MLREEMGGLLVHVPFLFVPGKLPNQYLQLAGTPTELFARVAKRSSGLLASGLQT